MEWPKSRTFALFLLLAAPAPARAQEEPRFGGAETRFAAGVVWQRGIFGDDDPEAQSAAGLIVGMQLRHRTTGRVGASLELAFQPIGLPNPHFDEALHTLYVLAGPEIGRRLYVRPVGGVALQIWSGSRAESAFSFALAAGVAVGWSLTSRDGRFRPELVVRCSASPGALSTMIGVQVGMR
jgi:hypothetical protein